MKRPGLETILKTQFAGGYKKGYTDGIEFALDKYSAVVLLCLQDKFDFNPDQLQEAVVHINNNFDNILEGRISFDDVIQTLREETGLNLLPGKVNIAKEGDKNGK